MHKCTRLRTMSRNSALYRTFLFLSTIPVCCGVLVNRTIDSKFGDPATGFMPIYRPQSLWSYNNCIPACTIQPENAFDGTWNWTTYEPNMPSVNITLQFTGVAIWVFFILSNLNNYQGFAANTYVNITLDGQHAGIFSHDADTSNTSNLIYNATIFSTSGLTNKSHKLVVGTNSYPNSSYLNFDWAIYTADINASASPIGIIVGSTLGGLAAITLIIVFFVRRLRRVPPIRNGKAEGILDIDVPPHIQPFYEREIPVPDRGPTQGKAARLREARQRELEEHIQSAQHELDNFNSLRNAGFSGGNGDPSAAGPSQRSPELALLRNEMQQLRNRMDYLQAQRESDWALGLSNEPVPPAYTQRSNNVQ